MSSKKIQPDLPSSIPKCITELFYIGLVVLFAVLIERYTSYSKICPKDKKMKIPFLMRRPYAVLRASDDDDDEKIEPRSSTNWRSIHLIALAVCCFIAGATFLEGLKAIKSSLKPANSTLERGFHPSMK